MNYSAKAKVLHDYVSANPGIKMVDIARRYDYKMIKRLIDAGVLTAEALFGRGNPKRLYAGTAPPAERRPNYQKTDRLRNTCIEDAIKKFLSTRGEATIGEISLNIERPSSYISGTLLRMTAQGKLVRRRVLGQIRGKTQACEWYSYRLA